MSAPTGDLGGLRSVADELESRLWRIGQEVGGDSDAPELETLDGIPHAEQVQRLFYDASEVLGSILAVIGRP